MMLNMPMAWRFWAGSARMRKIAQPPKHPHLKPKGYRYLSGCFRKYWYPQIIHFNRVFHYKPSIFGYLYFWKHPSRKICKVPLGFLCVFFLGRWALASRIRSAETFQVSLVSRSVQNWYRYLPRGVFRGVRSESPERFFFFIWSSWLVVMPLQGPVCPKKHQIFGWSKGISSRIFLQVEQWKKGKGRVV